MRDNVLKQSWQPFVCVCLCELFLFGWGFPLMNRSSWDRLTFNFPLKKQRWKTMNGFWILRSISNWFRKINTSGGGNLLPRFMPIWFSSVHIVLRCFRKGNLRKCFSFCRRVSLFWGLPDKSGEFLCLPCSLKMPLLMQFLLAGSVAISKTFAAVVPLSSAMSSGRQLDLRYLCWSSIDCFSNKIQSC